MPFNSQKTVPGQHAQNFSNTSTNVALQEAPNTDLSQNLGATISYKNLTKTGTENRWGGYDTGAAAENLCLQATALGLMAHQMGGFDADKTRALFNIPEQFTPMAIIAVGYQLAEADIPEELTEREYNPRQRNAINDNFFNGEWDVPIQ